MSACKAATYFWTVLRFDHESFRSRSCRACCEWKAGRFFTIITALRDEAIAYLERKTEEMRTLGVAKVSYLARDGFAADEIIGVARNASGNLIAMCTHGRSGIKRWALGSVTETIVRHSGDPVLVMRAG